MISIVHSILSECNKISPDTAWRLTKDNRHTKYLFCVGANHSSQGFEECWAVCFQATGVEVYSAHQTDTAHCVISVPKEDDFIAMAAGKMNPTSAFMQGKIKVKGDMALAMKLQTIFNVTAGVALSHYTPAPVPYSPPMPPPPPTVERLQCSSFLVTGNRCRVMVTGDGNGKYMALILWGGNNVEAMGMGLDYDAAILLAKQSANHVALTNQMASKV